MQEAVLSAWLIRQPGPGTPVPGFKKSDRTPRIRSGGVLKLREGYFGLPEQGTKVPRVGLRALPAPGIQARTAILERPLAAPTCTPLKIDLAQAVMAGGRSPARPPRRPPINPPPGLTVRQIAPTKPAPRLVSSGPVVKTRTKIKKWRLKPASNCPDSRLGGWA